MKHIVIVTPYYAPAWSYGGPPRVLTSLAESLIRKGVKVSVITTDSLGEKRTEVYQEKIGKVEVYRHRSISNTLCYKFKFFFAPNLLSRSLDVLKNADAVLFADIRSPLSWQVFSYLITNNIPYGIFTYGQVERGSGFRAIIKYVFDLLWVYRFVHHAQCVFASTNYGKEVAQSVVKALPKQVFSSLLPIPSEFTVEKTSATNFRKRYLIPAKAFTMLFVGRIHYLKGIDLLIEAVTPMMRKDANLFLCIVGRDDGAERTLCQMVPKTLVKRIIFTGPLYDSDAKTAYAASDLFVFTPRFFEETSTAALEALAVGTPVVTTIQADIPFLEAYQAGYVVNNAPEEIRFAISKILNHPDKKKLSVQAKKLIHEKYLAVSVADQLMIDMKLNKQKKARLW